MTGHEKAHRPPGQQAAEEVEASQAGLRRNIAETARLVDESERDCSAATARNARKTTRQALVIAGTELPGIAGNKGTLTRSSLTAAPKPQEGPHPRQQPRARQRLER